MRLKLNTVPHTWQAPCTLGARICRTTQPRYHLLADRYTQQDSIGPYFQDLKGELRRGEGYCREQKKQASYIAQWYQNFCHNYPLLGKRSPDLSAKNHQNQPSSPKFPSEPLFLFLGMFIPNLFDKFLLQILNDNRYAKFFHWAGSRAQASFSQLR